MEPTLFSSVNGTVIPIESVADPAFSEKIMGDGLAVRPALTRQAVLSPAPAVVSNVSRTGHAVTLLAAGRVEVLIHIAQTLKALGAKAVLHNSPGRVEVIIGQEAARLMGLMKL